MEAKARWATDLKLLEDKRRLREFFARLIFGLVAIFLVLPVAADRFKAGDVVQQFELFQSYVLLFSMAFGIVALRRFPRPAIAALGFACIYYALPAWRSGVFGHMFDPSGESNESPLQIITSMFVFVQWALMLTGLAIAWPLRKSPRSL